MSVFKLKIVGKSDNILKDLYKGHEVLNCPEGTLFQVSVNSVANHGDIVKRIRDPKNPRCPLKTVYTKTKDNGNLWGMSLGGYIFITLHGQKESDYIKF